MASGIRYCCCSLGHCLHSCSTQRALLSSCCALARQPMPDVQHGVTAVASMATVWPHHRMRPGLGAKPGRPLSLIVPARAPGSTGLLNLQAMG